MGGVVDYSTTSLGQPIGPLLKGPIDAVSAEIERQQADEEKRKLLQMQLDQRDRSVARLAQADENKNAYYQRKMDLADKREQGKLVMENQKRRDAAEADVRKAVGNGDIPLAESIGARFQQMDPATGEVRQGLEGFAVQPHGGQAEPTPPDAMTAAMSNPVTRLAGITDQDINQARGPEAPPQDFQAQHDAWQGAPDIIALHGQPLDREVIRHSAARAAGEDFAQVGAELQAQLAVAQQSGDQAAAAQIQRRLQLHGQLQPLVENGQIAPEKAAQTLMAGDADLRARDIQAERDATSRANTQTNAGARVEAARIGGDFGLRRQGLANEGKTAAQTSGADPKAYARLQADMKDFDKQFNVSKDRADESRVATLLNNKDAQVVQRAIAANVARGIGAEKGVLTDKDVERFQGHLGGLWGDVQNWLEGKTTGDFGPEKMAKLEEALRITLEEKAHDRQVAREAFPKVFMRKGYPGQTWGFGDDIANRYEAMFGEPYVAKPQRGVPRDTSNPDDPNAPDAGRPLDGDVGEDRTGGIDRATLLQEARRRGLVP